MTIAKRLVIIFMFLSFLLLAVTGVIRLPEIQKYFLFVYNFLPASTISFIHDWNGTLLVILIIIHLILKREALKIVFNLKFSKIFARIIYITIGVLIGLIIFKYLGIFNYLNNKKTIKLSAVQVTEYQGEKLGSIYDFRENSIGGTQYIDKNSYRLEITGLVSTPSSYSYDDILKLPTYQKIVTINCVEGWSVKALWGGVLIKDLLKNLTIKSEAKTLIFYAVDGYSTSFPLDYIINNNIILADKLNGVELPPERGFPFQLVAEQKWGYKWIKWINKIELSSDTDYKGFWESRGYNNDGSLDGSKYE